MKAPVCIWCSGDVQLVQGVGRAANSCSLRYVPLGTEHIFSQKYVRELVLAEPEVPPSLNSQRGLPASAARGVTAWRDGEENKQRGMPLCECGLVLQTLRA